MVNMPSISPRPISHGTEEMNGYRPAKNAVQNSATTMKRRGPTRSTSDPAYPLSNMTGRANATKERPTANDDAPREVRYSDQMVSIAPIIYDATAPQRIRVRSVRAMYSTRAGLS